MLFKRKGKFVISRELIIDNPEVCLAILKDVLIVKAETEFMRNVVSYQGYSEHFAEVQEGHEVPVYRPSFGRDENGEYIFTGWES